MKKLTLYLLFIYLAFGTYLFIQQRQFIYFPVPESQTKLPEKIFNNGDYKIKATVLNDDKKNAIIYFGGNAENVDNNAALYSQLFPEHSVYLVKYRGYNGSSGSPSEEAFYSDANLIFDVLKQKHTDISIIGRSLGSGVATYIAAHKPIHKLVLITPFDSVTNVAQALYPVYPISMMLKDKFDSLSRAKAINVPTLVIAAENDKVIDLSHTQRLVEQLNTELSFHIIEQASHNSIANKPKYQLLIKDFLSKEPMDSQQSKR